MSARQRYKASHSRSDAVYESTTRRSDLVITVRCVDDRQYALLKGFKTANHKITWAEMLEAYVLSQQSEK